MDDWTIKNHMRWRIFDNVIYTLACIITCGLVYLIRVIITEGVRLALWELDDVKEWRKANLK